MLLGALLLLIAHGVAAAQNPSPYGRRFLIAFPDTMRNRTGAVKPVDTLHDEIRLIIFSSDTASVTVTGPGYSKKLRVLPSRSTILSLTDSTLRPQQLFVDRPNVASTAVFELTSDKPVSLYCYFETLFGSEAFTPFPVESWGTDYYAMTLGNQYINDVPDPEENVYPLRTPSEIVVIASQNGTAVTIAATDSVIGPRARTVTLDAGQAYLIESSTRDTLVGDLSGSHITADKPIAVLSGNTRQQGGIGANLIRTPSGNSSANTIVEWLDPVSAAGKTFVYRPLAPQVADSSEELIRIYGISPGVTTVVSSNGGPTRYIPQGSFAEYSSLLFHSGDSTQPFALHADRPALGMVVSGSYAIFESPFTDYLGARTWGPAMANLVPYERWITFGRFNTPDFPPALKHYVVIVADSSARLWLDGKPVSFSSDPVVGSPFVHARISVAPGDHALRSSGGTFSAIAFGQQSGQEKFAPPGTRRDDDGSGGRMRQEGARDRSAEVARKRAHLPSVLHKSVYTEYLSIAYAYPVLGRSDADIPADSLEFTRSEKCDSTLAVVQRVGPLWTATPLNAALDPASINTVADITPDYTFGILSGYHIRLAPRDPGADASGRVVVTTLPGRVWYIPFVYKAHTVAIAPDPVEMIGIPANQPKTLGLKLTNQKPFSATVLWAKLLHEGTSGFTLPDLSQLPKPLFSGGSFSLPLSFTGSIPEQIYTDTLILGIEPCRNDTIPVSARTAPLVPKPVPLITGYDWKGRPVGSANDTLSFISNAGSLGFSIKEVAIVSDPNGAFSLTVPDWKGIPPVQPGERYPTGIRFTPPSAGSFAAEIRLVTDGGDTVRAGLLGTGLRPAIQAPDLEMGNLCIALGGIKDTSVGITNGGNMALTIYGLELTGSAAVTIDTSNLKSPRLLLPGQGLTVPVRISTETLGPIDATIVIHSDAPRGDSIVIGGYVASCSNARLAVDDHDFDTVWVGLTKPGFVTLRNLGGGDVLVSGMKVVDDTAGAFQATLPTLPFIVRDGDSVRVACSFSPLIPGLQTARIEFQTELGRLYSNLRGVGKKLLIPAHISRDYHAQPGDLVTVYADLDSSLAGAPVDSLAISLGYDSRLLDFLGLTDSTVAAGWMMMPQTEPDTLRFRIAGLASPPGAGHLLGVDFLTRFTLLDSSELPFTVSTGLPYVEIVERPGLFRRDSICGLVDRLFEFSRYKFRLDQNRPNPIERSGTIEFEIPFDNYTTLIVYDMLGAERMRLTDRFLTAGVYTVTIAENSLAAGAYQYRLRSGEYSTTRRMVVQ
jgi:hypothetical protein